MGSIHVSNLGKAFKQYHRRWSRLAEWTLPWIEPQHELKWVLRDVSFTIAPGESVGLIGVNGAGKSTLLKLITGTTLPTEGHIASSGRVAALLELGMGFHPNFTGRQNVMIAGQLLGLSVEEISELLPQIEAFAEIGSYIDEPVRVYSSGMQMRLAFSVATCVRPDVLIVDEALAVGDVFFQQKCFARIKAFTDAGTTLLFVSHSAGTVLNICSRCLLLRQGALVFDGLPREAIDLYQADLLLENTSANIRVVRPQLFLTGDTSTGDKLNGKGATASLRVPSSLQTTEPVVGRTGSIVTTHAQCLAVLLVDAAGEPVKVMFENQLVRLFVGYRLNQPFSDPHVGFKIRNRFGVVIFETNSYCMREQLGAVQEGGTLTVSFTFAMNLFPEEYTVTVGLGQGGHGQGSFEAVLSYLHEVLAFTVVASPDAITWEGVTNLHPQMSYKINSIN